MQNQNNDYGDNHAAVHDALGKLESAFETPVVPGEWSSWLTNVRRPLARVGDLLRREIRNEHAERFRSIIAEKPGLTARVEQMKAEDEAILRDLAECARQIAALEADYAEAPSNEPADPEELAPVTKSGTDFVVRVRTQEKALQTWHSEAYQRDQGVAD